MGGTFSFSTVSSSVNSLCNLGGMKVFIPVLCLDTVFLFEGLKGRLKEDEDVMKRYLNNRQDAADRAG